MEIKKSKKADLEGQKGTSLLIGYVVTLAAMFAAFEWTTHEYEEKSQVFTTPTLVQEEEIVPITAYLHQHSSTTSRCSSSSRNP